MPDPGKSARRTAALGLRRQAEGPLLARLRASIAGGTRRPVPGLEAACRRAWETGDEIDLDGCVYGPLLPRCPLYYRFLAGLVRSQGLRRIVELGTHYGGSICAMSRGLPPGAEGRLVTVDVRPAPAGFAAAARPVTQVVGDIMSPATAAETTVIAGRADLLLIDFNSVGYCALSALNVYAAALRPAIVVIDDIHLNPSMGRLWRQLSASFGGFCFDATRLARRDDPQVSPLAIGLGVIAWREATV